jgi:hypothetical protein
MLLLGGKQVLMRGGDVRAVDGSMAGVPEAREEDELQVGQVGWRVSNRVRRVNRNVMGE